VSVLVIDKPSGPSSFQVVREIRAGLTRLWGRSGRRLKVGHGGTLDPLASGVLPICIGEGTKIAPFLLGADKEYEAAVRFGLETDTFDAAGTVVAEHPLPPSIELDVLTALPRFLGALAQVPPMYSALKREGRPLYEYAREGKEVERSPRPVVIHSLDVLSWEPPDTLRLRIRCSKGTYVRALASDLGQAVAVGAHLVGLRRTVSGPFDLSQAVTLGDFRARVQARGSLPLIALADALAHLPAVTAPAAAADALRHGRPLPAAELGFEDTGPATPVRVLRPDGSLLAIARLDGARVRALRVFGRSDLPPDVSGT
jgi:tRNA pseudouridine55 synthase